MDRRLLDRHWDAFDAFGVTLLLLACACATRSPQPRPAAATPSDPHSLARPQEVVVEHLDLDLTVDFAAQALRGTATLRPRQVSGSRLTLDTRGLTIAAVRLDPPASRQPQWRLAGSLPDGTQGLEIDLDPGTRTVAIDYSTGAAADALQWLEPRQTAGGKHPFLFTQSQAVLARTWVPCQDTPAVRMTYDATVRVPAELMAVMSAENPTARTANGVYRFRMPQAVPSYLLALSVGDLAFRPLGERSGVYAEPAVLDGAAWELADTEQMIAAAEALYGPYRWGRYDLLILPPAFPFGGMENPRLTFATPTILAGDRSLVSLIAHELAHSWSGNLVTNATWNDFWLNEGFTVYFEQRIMEAVYGRETAEMEALLGLQGLRATIDDLGATSPLTHLRLRLGPADNPDDSVNDIAYQKGYFFLRLIEETVGRERFDSFLRSYFDRHAFRSMTTEDFLAELRTHLLDAVPGAEAKLDVAAWVDGPGLPANAPTPRSAALTAVDAELRKLAAGAPPARLDTAGWKTQQWLHFLRNLPTPSDLAALDQAFGFTRSGNAEIAAAWFERAIRADYRAAFPALEEFLVEVGRRKFLRPLYTELAKTPAGKEWALRVYARARPGYHAVSAATVDSILGWEGAAPVS
jgi:aminopeptidase N